MTVASPTGASSDLYRALRAGLCVRSRTPSRRSRGSAGRCSGSAHDLCLDLVSRPDAFARLWPKLRAGYLLDALERLDGKPTPARERRGVPRRGSTARRSTRQPSVGLGEDVRLRGRAVIGSGLELDGRAHPALGVPQRGRRPRARSAGSRARAGGCELRRFTRWGHRPAVLRRIDRERESREGGGTGVAQRRFAAMAADCGWRP